MADERPCRLCLHEFPQTGGRAHIDLFVRAAWRITALSTFEIAAEFAAVLGQYPAAAPGISGQPAAPGDPGRDRVGDRGPLLRLYMLPGEPAGDPGAGWRAQRKADHRLKYWRHSGPIDGLDPEGRSRGVLRELARGVLVGAWPTAGVSGGVVAPPDAFWFTLEPRPGI